MLPVMVLPDYATEDALLVRARRGDQTAVMEIYELYFTPVYQYVRLRVDDTMQAEDLTSEIFIALIVALRDNKAPRQSLRGWLFRVARNTLHDHRGKVRRFPTTTLEDWVRAPHEDQPEVQFLQSVGQQQARQAVAMLKDAQQEVLILRFGQGLSLQDTAAVMGKSVTAIKSLQFRAVATLRELLTTATKEVEDGR